jgi:RNA polymerase sigma factor (sigma-70 family)
MSGIDDDALGSPGSLVPGAASIVPTQRRTPSSHTLAGVLSRIQAGARGADDPELARKLDQAFAKHESDLRRRCRKELRGASAERVDEIVQDVLLEAWAKLPVYRAETEFRGFLWGIARLKCANARRKSSDVLTEDGLLKEGSEEQHVLARLADEQRDALIEEASNNVLDAADQELVQLRWVLDYPLDDVVERLGFADNREASVALQRCKRRLEKEILRLLQQRGLGQSFLT